VTPVLDRGARGIDAEDGVRVVNCGGRMRSVSVSIRLTLSLSVLSVLASPAVALANHHHIGGSGSGSADDGDADCLVWGYVVLDGGSADRPEVSDAADAGDASADAATSDGGAAVPAGAVLVCLEHATMFGCDCAAGGAAGQGWSRGAVALAIAVLAARRRRSTASSKGRP
jgi:MYXO-CTERM domain-containing protein